MYLFSRWATLVGNPRATMGWAMEAASYVAGASGREVGLWSVEFGAPVGSVAWTATAESLADLNATFAPLAADDGYLDLLDKGAEFLSAPAQDHLREVVRASADASPPAVGAVANLITAVAANGKIAEALGWGAEISAYTESITGLPSLFLADAFDDFGRMSWIGVAPDHAALDAATGKLNADSGYHERLGQVGDLFTPGSGRSSLLARLA
jgi:hypothetical protein